MSSAEEELATVVELLLVSTNFEFEKYYEGEELHDEELVKNMLQVLDVLRSYCTSELRDKLGAVMSVYSGSIIPT